MPLLRAKTFLMLIPLLLMACSRQPAPPSVIWITGGLGASWLPLGQHGSAPAGGLSRIARALELYRQPGDLLVDLGNFRYPRSVSGQERAWRLRGDGFMKSLARLNYTLINVASADRQPLTDDFYQRARTYGLPIADSCASAPFKLTLLRVPYGKGGVFTVLLTDAAPETIAVWLDSLTDVDLVLWQNEGSPQAREIGGILVLGLGSASDLLGRVEIRASGAKPRLDNSDLTGWSDGKPYRHHPVRERLKALLCFWRSKPALCAYLWAIPEALSPQQQAEQQRQQTQEALRRYYDLEDLHRRTPSEFAGPAVCLKCHDQPHPRNLDHLHEEQRPEVQQYPVYEHCFPCHTTGFDDPGGFLYPTERPDLLTVSCEACHDAALAHALSSGAPLPEKPGEEGCGRCHNHKNACHKQQ